MSNEVLITNSIVYGLLLVGIGIIILGLRVKSNKDKVGCIALGTFLASMVTGLIAVTSFAGFREFLGSVVRMGANGEGIMLIVIPVGIYLVAILIAIIWSTTSTEEEVSHALSNLAGTLKIRPPQVRDKRIKGSVG